MDKSQQSNQNEQKSHKVKKTKQKNPKTDAPSQIVDGEIKISRDVTIFYPLNIQQIVISSDNVGQLVLLYNVRGTVNNCKLL